MVWGQETTIQGKGASMTLTKNITTLADIPVLCVITCVDKVPPEEWNTFDNGPTDAMKTAIERKAKDLTNRIHQGTGLALTQIEYCSAVKRYRLYPVVTAVVKNARNGVRVLGLHPKDSWELASPEARAFVEQERLKRSGGKPHTNSPNQIMEEIGKTLSPVDAKRLQAAFKDETAKPAKIAVLGKAGAGKTTLVNNAFSANFKTSHTIVGSDKAQMKEFEVEGGGKIEIIDLPGYGRSISEDKTYETIYSRELPGCDLVILVIQANTRDLADDIDMVAKLRQWMRNSP